MNPYEALALTTHFGENENWGDISKVHFKLFEKLDLWRTEIGNSILISPAKGAVYAENRGHSDASWHYIIPGRNDFAMAADTFPTGNLMIAWIIATKYFNGVGFYPEWKYARPNKPTIYGGLHVDIRSTKRAYWVRQNGKYVNIDKDNIPQMFELMLKLR